MKAGIPLLDALTRKDCSPPVRDAETIGIVKDQVWDPILRVLPEAVAVEASNVCHYLHVDNDQAAFTVDDFPLQIPPFPVLWIEMAAPPASVSDKEITPWRTDAFGARWGALYTTVDLNAFDDDEADGFLVETLGWANHHGFDFRVGRSGARWITRANYFVWFGGDRFPVGPLFDVIAVVDQNGDIARSATSDGDAISWMELIGIVDPESTQAAFLSGNMHTWVDPMMMTLSMMNCRNVTRVENAPPRFRSRQAVRRGDPPPTRYYTLVIDPMRIVLQEEGGVRRNGIKKALHICRGHFAHYATDKPLFGRYAGTFWRPAHVRGTVEAGQVVKDYAVKPSKGRTA